MQRRNNLLLVAIPVMLILLGAVVYQHFYLNLRSRLSDTEEATAVKMEMLGEYTKLIAERPRLEERLAALKEARKAENATMIEGPTAAVAAAFLQNTVKEMITSRGGSISSELVEKAEDAGAFKMITVTMDAVLPDIGALADTLYAIESQTPALVVREMDARIRNFKDPKDLAVRLKVSGLTGGR